MTIAAKQQATPGTAAAAPDPPTYAKCVAALQKQPVAKGQAKPTVAALKAQCAQQYDGLKTQVMQFLIQSQWLLQEASERRLTAKPAEVQKQLERPEQAVVPQARRTSRSSSRRSGHGDAGSALPA